MTAYAKTLTRSCLLAGVMAAAIAQPALAQFSSTETYSGIGLGFAHNEQGQTAPSTTSTMPTSSLASVTLLDPTALKPHAATPSLAIPLPIPLWPSPSADLRTHMPSSDLSISNAAVPPSASTVPAPGPATLLALAATAALRRKRR